MTEQEIRRAAWYAGNRAVWYSARVSVGSLHFQISNLGPASIRQSLFAIFYSPRRCQCMNDSETQRNTPTSCRFRPLDNTTSKDTNNWLARHTRTPWGHISLIIVKFILLNYCEIYMVKLLWNPPRRKCGERKYVSPLPPQFKDENLLYASFVKNVKNFLQFFLKCLPNRLHYITSEDPQILKSSKGEGAPSPTPTLWRRLEKTFSPLFQSRTAPYLNASTWLKFVFF